MYTMMLKPQNNHLLLLLFAVISLTACNKVFNKSSADKRSHSTGWEYNNPDKGGFEVTSNFEQETGPGLVFIEGGSFVMGSTQEDIFQEWDNPPRKVTVPSFYIDETEVSNLDYLEYLHWLKNIYGEDHPEVYIAALPDTLVWREQLAYNEPLVEMYLRHPSYHNYPVVGVSWLQATEYCTWRTDRVNERLLIDAGAFAFDPNQKNENHFNTEAYLAGQYKAIAAPPEKTSIFNRRRKNQNQEPNFSIDAPAENRVKWEDGIMLPSYRLPTEAEWEYAALGLIGNMENGQLIDRRTYPWDGHKIRSTNKKYEGSFVANFKRGEGDFMGVAGSLNDGSDITAPVGSYWANDYGVYNMAGNVSEWVQDVYRALSFEDVSEYSPFRGNVFMEKVRNPDGTIAQKDSLGRIRYQEINEEDIKDRRNYRKANNINYRDGDNKSILNADWLAKGNSNIDTKSMYNYGVNSLISDESRVYKGGSWKDPAYFLSPSVRRYLHQNEASNSIGFRCAMSRMGNTIPK